MSKAEKSGDTIVSFDTTRPRTVISDETLKRYDGLRIRVVLTAEPYQTAGRPSLGEVWRWFRSTRWHRRGAGSLWDRRPAGIGRSPLASFADLQRDSQTGLR